MWQYGQVTVRQCAWRGNGAEHWGQVKVMKGTALGVDCYENDSLLCNIYGG